MSGITDKVKAKLTVNNVASVAIIYPTEDPSQVFHCEYDEGYPTVVFRRKDNPMGGNWIGPLAASDRGPKDTLRRELEEELVLSGPPADQSELVDLGLLDQVDPNEAVPGKSSVVIDPNDACTLDKIRSYIQRALRPWGSYYHHVPKAVFDTADSQNKKGDISTFVCCWLAALGPGVWSQLELLQKKYGNLTNEGYTRITSLSEIVRDGRLIAWGHRQAYYDFWMTRGLTQACLVPRIEGILSIYAGPIPRSYQEVLRNYDVLRTPFTK